MKLKKIAFIQIILSFFLIQLLILFSSIIASAQATDRDLIFKIALAKRDIDVIADVDLSNVDTTGLVQKYYRFRFTGKKKHLNKKLDLSNKVVILGHGLGSNAASLALQAQKFMELGYNVEAINLRGHGWGTENTEAGNGNRSYVINGSEIDYAVHRMSEDWALAAQRVSRKYKNVSALGHSMGAMTLAESTFAIRDLPIDKIILLGGPANFDFIPTYLHPALNFIDAVVSMMPLAKKEALWWLTGTIPKVNYPMSTARYYTLLNLALKNPTFLGVSPIRTGVLQSFRELITDGYSFRHRSIKKPALIITSAGEAYFQIPGIIQGTAPRTTEGYWSAYIPGLSDHFTEAFVESQARAVVQMADKFINEFDEKNSGSFFKIYSENRLFKTDSQTSGNLRHLKSAKSEYTCRLIFQTY